MSESVIEQTERSILSAILNYKAGIELAASAGLKPEHFSDPEHRAVYRACCDLAVESVGIDLVTVSDRLQQSGQLDRIGGREFLAELLTVVSSSANVKHHADILIEHHLESRVLSIAKGMERVGAGYGALAEVERRLAGIKQDLPVGQSDEPLFTNESLDECVTRIMTKPEDNKNLFTTDIAPLDRVIYGFERGTVTSFNGLGGTGKTKLAIQILVRTARRGTPVGFLSLEMSKFRVMRWMLSHVCRIDSKFLQSPHRGQWDGVREEYLGKIADKRGELASLPIYVNDIAYPTVDQIEAIVSAWTRQGVGLVIMDYLERMVLGKDWRDEGYPTARLADIAKKCDVAFVYLDHCNKTANKPGVGLSASQLRGSEMRKSNADLVIQLRNISIERSDRAGLPEPYARIDALVVKGREGATGARIEDRIIANLATGCFRGREEHLQLDGMESEGQHAGRRTQTQLS